VRWLWAAVDCLAWPVSIFLAAWLRYDFHVERTLESPLLWFTAAAVACQLLFGALFGPYAVGHLRGSFEETADIGRTVVLTTGVLMALVFLAHLEPIPRSVPFTAPAFALLGMFSARFIVRTTRTSRRGHEAEEDAPVVVFGAGEAGRRLTRSLIRDEESGYRPVALLDDDKSKARLRIEGVKVRGTRAHITKVADKYQASTLVIALPRAEAVTIREITKLATDAGLEVLVLPPVREIIGGRPTADDLRNVDVADLLGRRPICIDTTMIAEQLAC
jgi:FlaA1/EpsC-like NDP-sugar epimerase